MWFQRNKKIDLGEGIDIYNTGGLHFLQLPLLFNRMISGIIYIVVICATGPALHPDYKRKVGSMGGIKENKEKSYAGTGKFMLVMRIVVAAYLLYLSYTLLQSYMKGEGLPFYVLIIAVTVFSGVAAVVAAFAVKALIKGEYSGGKADKSAVDIEETPDSMLPSADGDDEKDGGMLSERLKKYNKI